ncbi:MAG TPA: DUF5666 domain-containing protein, partial [Thermoanaerobaculia bacterium]|nr:DUF5666 domain-containing protein [Thermoanaerobaculia bacterium]
MRSKVAVLTIAVAALFAVSCRRHESSPTASYGDSLVSGQVVMASGMANSSPAGVEVSVVGTGMSATLAADGRFSFAGVPDNAEITFRRGDGINARIGSSDANGALELSANGVTKTAGKRRGTSPDDPKPHQQIEGTITNVAADGSTITVHDSHGTDDKVTLTSTTLIRKGDKVVKATDLATGDRVHVKATMVNNVLTASQVIVQEQDDDTTQPPAKQTQEIEGTVVKASSSSITVHDSHGKDVTATIDSSTVVRKGQATVDPSTLQPGDRVHVKATAATDGTLTATEIIVQNTGDHGGAMMEASGTVKSV